MHNSSIQILTRIANEMKDVNTCYNHGRGNGVPANTSTTNERNPSLLEQTNEVISCIKYRQRKILFLSYAEVTNVARDRSGQSNMQIVSPQIIK